MRLFVGLGNPGRKYARHRHNIGWMAVERIAEDHGFAPFRAKFQGRLSEGQLRGTKVALLLPETYMNESGRSVGAAARFHKVDPADIVVFHDEIDLAPGKLKCKSGGGHAGHNGLRSLHAHIGPDYARVRMGVGHPGHKDKVPGYVLSDFPKADEVWLDDMLRGISDGAADLAAGDTSRFMNAVSQRLAPARPSTGTRRPDPAPVATPATGAEPSPGPAPDPSPDSAPEDTRSPLERLVDRFR